MSTPLNTARSDSAHESSAQPSSSLDGPAVDCIPHLWLVLSQLAKEGSLIPPELSASSDAQICNRSFNKQFEHAGDTYTRQALNHLFLRNFVVNDVCIAADACTAREYLVSNVALAATGIALGYDKRLFPELTPGSPPLTENQIKTIADVMEAVVGCHYQENGSNSNTTQAALLKLYTLSLLHAALEDCASGVKITSQFVNFILGTGPLPSYPKKQTRKSISGVHLPGTSGPVPTAKAPRKRVKPYASRAQRQPFPEAEFTFRSDGYFEGQPSKYTHTNRMGKNPQPKASKRTRSQARLSTKTEDLRPRKTARSRRDSDDNSGSQESFGRSV